MFDVSFIYKIVDKFSAPSAQIQRSAERTKAAVKGMGNAARRMGSGIQNAGERLRGLANTATIAGGAIANFAIAMPTKAAIDFEKSVIDLDKAFDFKSAGQRAAFVNDLRSMGPGLGLMATETSALAFEAGKLGIAQADVAGFVDAVAQASVALDGLTPQEGVQISGDLMTRFGLDVEGVRLMLDSVNSLADGTNRAGGEILNVTSRLSGQFQALKFPPELATGLATFARQIATTDELASSGMKMFLRELDQAKLAAAPLETITAKLEEIAAISDVGERAAFIEDQFGKEAMTFVQGAVEGLDTLGKTMSIVADKSNFAGSSGKEFQKQMGSTAMQAQVLRAQFNDLLITIGERLLPVMKRAIEGITPFIAAVKKFIDENPNVVKAAAAFVAVATAVVGLGVLAGFVIGLLNPVTLLVAGVVGLGAAIVSVWDDFKGFLADVTGPFKILADGVAGFMGNVERGAQRVGRFFGIGEEDPTIANPNPGLAIDQARQNHINGQINIAVDGPGKVTHTDLTTDLPGNLGMNLGATR